MAETALVAKFGGKKRPPKFEDDGPPTGSDQGRGSGSGPSGDSYGADSAMPDDGGMDDTGAGPDPSMPDNVDPAEKSVDDMADILGVGPEDRQDFANALKTYVHACLAEAMGPPDMGAMPSAGPESEPDMEGGPESSEEE